MKNDSLGLSIILPNYNHSIFLEKRIESILSQTFQDYELIILDDFSSDESLTILEKYSNHPKVSHCVFNKKNSGSTFIQWEKGISLAKGEYIWLAESDDFSDPVFLKYTIEKLELYPKMSFVYTQSYVVNEEDTVLNSLVTYTNELDEYNFWKSDFNIDGNRFNEKYLAIKNVVPNASAVVFRKSHVDFQWFENLKKFSMAGDWLFWLLLSSKGEVGFISKEYNNFRTQSMSTRNHKTLALKQKRIIEEVLIFEIFTSITKVKIERSKTNLNLLHKWFSITPLQKIFSNRIINQNLIKYNKTAVVKLCTKKITNKIKLLLKK